MLNQLVVDSKGICKLVDVVRSLFKKIDYLYPIVAPAGASKKEPKQAPSIGIRHVL
jgi:hypothetical protein